MSALFGGLPLGRRFGRWLIHQPRVAIHGLFAAALLLLVLITVWLSWRSHEEARESGRLQLATIADTLEQHAIRSFTEAARSVWSAGQLIGAYEGPEHWDEWTVHRRVQSLAAGSPQIRSLLVADANGHVIADSRAYPARRFNIGDRDYFLTHREGEPRGEGVLRAFLGAPVQGRVDPIWIAGLSMRLQTPDGAFAGIVNASIDIGYFIRFYQSIGQGRGHEIALLREDGVLLAAEPAILPVGSRIDVANLVLATGSEGRPVVLDRHPLTGSGGGMYVVRHLGANQLRLVVGLPESRLFANWRFETERVAMVVLFAAILLTLGFGVVLRYIDSLNRAQELGRRLISAIEEAHDQLSLYDGDDRLWFANKRFWAMNRGNAEIGLRFEDILREGVCRGHYPDAFGREEEWIADRVRRRENPGDAFEIARQGGRWLRVRDQKLPEGGTITIATDVTDRKLFEQALQEQAERHRRIIDTVPHGICATDTECNILFANKAMHRMFRVPEGGLVGRSIFEFEENDRLAEERRQQVRGWYERMRAPERYTHRFRAQDGTRIDVEVDWDYNRAPDGTLEGFAGVFTDITELRRAKDRLQDAVDSIDSGFSLFDAADRLVLCNAAYVAANPKWRKETSPVGLTFEKLAQASLEGSVADTLALSDPDAWLARRVELHRNPPRAPFEQRLVDGRWLLIQERRTREGGIVGIHTDITASKLQERALIEAKTQAELASRAKSDFLANMSHELRTPLNAIIGFADMLRQQFFGQLNTKQQEYAVHIQSSGEHLLNIINDILDMSKIEAGRFDLAEEVVDIAQPVGDSIGILSARAAEKGIAMVNMVHPAGILVSVDVRSLKQVLLNLLSNAIKFTGAGGHVWVSTRARADGGLEILVRDDGVGIASENLEKVFEPFLQGDGLVSRKFGGTGLGLSISRKLMQVHGGGLELESAEGVGTVVRAILPAERLVVRSPRRTAAGK